MATQEAVIKALLTSDGAFTTLASGGTYLTPDDFDTNDGATPTNLDREGAYDANGALKPTAVIKFDSDSRSNIPLGEMRFFNVYLYEERGFTNIRALKRRIKTVLDRVTPTADHTTANYIEYVDSGPEFIDDSMQNASASWVRFFVLYARSS